MPLNTRLYFCILPARQKEAIITPVSKKPSLDLDEPRNYRPISNLSFISKLIERIVSEQVRAFLIDSDLMPPLQSAYRPGHSTETALVKVISDIIDAADEKKVTLLSLLDMSAAFDTVDFQILLHRLEVSYGLGVKYCSGFSLTCQIGSRLSRLLVVPLHIFARLWVPQGSVIGPLLFVLYAADVMKIAVQHKVRIHAYADDMQTYVSCHAADQQSACYKPVAPVRC